MEARRSSSWSAGRRLWVRDGLAPGEYVLSATPLRFAAADGPEYPVTLAEGRAELALALSLESPP
jgi:hypothetical protein